MARTKQAKPVERQPSSEYVTRQTSTPSKMRDEMTPQPNGVDSKIATVPVPAPAMAKKDAGVAQLVIAVAGIYGSLYV